jgi:hypothetical protein
VVFHQKPVHTSPLHCTHYKPRPSHSSRFHHPNNSGWGVEIMKLLIMKFSSVACNLVPLMPKYSPKHHILKQRQPTNLISVKFLLLTKSQLTTSAQHSCHLNAHIWSLTFSPFHSGRVCCEWFDSHKNCVGEFPVHVRLYLNTRVSKWSNSLTLRLPN